MGKLFNTKKTAKSWKSQKDNYASQKRATKKASRPHTLENRAVLAGEVLPVLELVVVVVVPLSVLLSAGATQADPLNV
jgi:hypothetical protein